VHKHRRPRTPRGKLLRVLFERAVSAVYIRIPALRRRRPALQMLWLAAAIEPDRVAMSFARMRSRMRPVPRAYAWYRAEATSRTLAVLVPVLAARAEAAKTYTSGPFRDWLRDSVVLPVIQP